VWSLFDRALFWSARSIELNAKLLQKVYFPRFLMPLAAFVPAVLDFLVYSTFTVATMAVYLWLDGTTYVQVTPDLALVPAALALVLVLALGMGLYLAVLGTQTRDVRFSLSYALGFWMFVTPIIYPLSAIPSKFRPLASLNPMTAPVEMVREGLYGIGDVTTVALTSSTVAAAFLCLTGIAFFNRWAAAAVDNV
jgi:lipopolysaccharide transport system permease protein